MKIRSVALLIVVSLFLGVSSVNATGEVYLKYKEDLSDSRTSYDIIYEPGKASLSYNYIRLNLNFSYGIDSDYFVFDINDSWDGGHYNNKSYVDFVDNSNVSIYLFRNSLEKKSGTIGTIIVKNVSYWDMTNFPGSMTSSFEAKKCEEDTLLVSQYQLYYGSDGSIVNSSSYYNQCINNDDENENDSNNSTENISSDATLGYLAISNVVLSPEFKPDVYEYSAYLPSDDVNPKIVATINDDGASIDSEFNAPVYYIYVTAANGNKKTYKINFVVNKDKYDELSNNTEVKTDEDINNIINSNGGNKNNDTVVSDTMSSLTGDSTLKCKIKDGKYYDKNGSEVSKDDYVKQCQNNKKTGLILPTIAITLSLLLLMVIYLKTKKNSKLFKI